MAIIKIPVVTDYILIVDDNVPFTRLAKAILDDEGEVHIVYDGEEAFNKLGEQNYDLVISDVDMPIMDGISFYRKAVQKYPAIKGKFLFMTGDASPECLAFFKECGIEYLLKPSSVTEIRIAARKILVLKSKPSSQG
jgi:two-component system chemotaxis response regulator CheY